MNGQFGQSVAETYQNFIFAKTAEGVSDITIRNYHQHLHNISKYLDVEKPMASLTKKDLENMICEMRRAGLAHNSVSTYVRVLRTFLNWCQKEGRTNITLPNMQDRETVKETYTDDELVLLLQKPATNCSFPEYRNWAIVNFLLNSGCRAGTLRAIQNRDVDLEHRQVISRHNKNNRIQSIPLCSQMVIILREYQKIRGGEATDSLFCDAYGGPLSENALRLAMERYNKSRGVESTGIHKFRHTFARKFLVDCGGNAFTLQRLLNHSTLKMTRHYRRTLPSDCS